MAEARQFDEHGNMIFPEIIYHEPFNKNNEKINGGFAIRFENGQFVNLNKKQILLFIPFIGSEKKCWECGGNRELILRCDLSGDIIDYDECCDKPITHP